MNYILQLHEKQFLQAGMVNSVHGEGVTSKNEQMYARFKVSSVDVEDFHLSTCYAMQWVI